MHNFESKSDESCITGFENIPDSVNDLFMMFFDSSCRSGSRANVDFSKFSSPYITKAAPLFQTKD